MNKYSVNQPQPIKRDVYGQKIEIGLRVAFNYQGEVRIGHIESINKNEWKISRSGIGTAKWWNLTFKLKIIQLNGDTSFVRNPRSFVII